MNCGTYLTMPGGMGIIDTGAVNAVMGAETLKATDKQLAVAGVGSVRTETPPTIGGIGGGVQPLMAILLPAMLDSVPGVLSVIVIPGAVPLLLPGPLLESLQACLDLRTKTIHWQTCHAYSEVHSLPSGHIGCNVVGDWSAFLQKVPGADQFRRTAEHSKHIESLSTPQTSLLASTSTPTQYFDLRGKEDEDQDEGTCKSYEAEWMPLQPSGSSSATACKQVSFATTHESGGSSSNAIHPRGREERQNKDELTTGVHPGRLLSTDSMVEVDAQVGVHHGSGVPPRDGVGDARPVCVCEIGCETASRNSIGSQGGCIGSPQVDRFQRPSQGGCGPTLCSPHSPCEGQCGSIMVSMQDLPGALPKREGGVHWPLTVDLGDMLCEWRVPSPSEYHRLTQTLQKGQPPTYMRCQFGHCPQLPWEDAGVDALDMGYTGRVRCLGFKTEPSTHMTTLVDRNTVPTEMWQGLILLERCGCWATDPSIETQQPPMPSISDASHVWSLVAGGEVCEHELADGSLLHLCTPQRKVPAPVLETNVDVLAYQVVLALEETAEGWSWCYNIREAWPVEGRRKQKAAKIENIVVGCMYAASAEVAKTWQQCYPWLPLPGIRIQQAVMWNGLANFESFDVPLADIVVIHCIQSEAALTSLRDKSVLLASTTGLSEQQTRLLQREGFHIGKSGVKGEVAQWLLASRPASLAIRLELAALPQQLHPTVRREEHEESGCWAQLAGHLATWSWRQLVDYITDFLDAHSLPLNTSRTEVGDQNTTQSSNGLRTLNLGATTSRRYGVTPSTTQHPWSQLLPYLLELARRRISSCQHPFLSITITTGAVSAHEDFNDSLTSLISVGRLSVGGKLLLEDQAVDTHEKWSLMDARQTHQVLPYDGGSRYAIAFYCPRDAAKLPTHALTLLRSLDFPVNWWASERCWRQILWEVSVEMHDESVLPKHIVSVEMHDESVLPKHTDSVEMHDESVLPQHLHLACTIVELLADMQYPVDMEDVVEQVGASAGSASVNAPPPEDETVLDSAHRLAASPMQEQDWLPDENGGLQEHEIETPSKAQQASLLRTHVNLGHPDLHSFLRSLRIGGVRRSVRAWVRFRFQCPACAAWRPRIQRRPAHISDVHRFNQAVAMDNFYVEVPNVGKLTVLHCICLGTRYQTARVVAQGIVPTAEAVLDAFVTSWVPAFAWPQAILVDAGVEFRGNFRDTLEHHGVYIGVINTQAPHENGICERAGGRLKELLQLSFEDTEPLTELDFRVALAAVTTAHHRFYDRSGFTPAQRVLGQSPVFPEDLLSDRHPDAEILSLNGNLSFERSMEIRSAALRAFVSHSVKQRLARAASAKARRQDEFKIGDIAFIIRQPRVGAAYRRLLPELVGHIPRNRRVRDLTDELQGDGLDQTPGVRFPPTPRLPGTPSAATRTRRLSVVSTAAPSGAGGTASQADGDHDLTPREVSSSNVIAPQDAENEVEPDADRTTERSVRRRLDPMIEAQVRRIEGAEPEQDPGMEMFQGLEVSEWTTGIEGPVCLADACGVYSDQNGRHNFVVTRKTTDELDPTSISAEDWPAFEEAIRKEGAKMLEEFRGLEVLSLADSEKVRREHGNRILPSRLHLKWKTESTSTGTKRSAKARWLLVGFHDPDVLTLDGAAPTPQISTVNVVLQVIASLGFEAYAGDFSTAFLQGDETRRLLWVTAPPYCEVLGLDRRQLLRVRKEVYGFGGCATEMETISGASANRTQLGTVLG
eukprot:2810998-Amphidinium_carterae.2